MAVTSTVCVGADEFDAAHAALNHVLHGVAAATADTDHLDLGAQVELFDFNHFDAHVFLLESAVA